MDSSFAIASLPQLTPAQAEAWQEVVAASMALDLPGVPPPTAEELYARLAGSQLRSRVLTWLATAPDGRVAGVASLRLFTGAGQGHLAEAELHVHPDLRKRGIGSGLLSELLAGASAEARRTVITQTPADTPAQRFCVSRGFSSALTLDHLILPLSELDPDRLDKLATADDPGYRLTRWRGTVPAELAPAFAAAKSAMNDMPIGEIDYGTVGWDADRVVRMAEVVADRGDTLLTVAALHDSDMAGFTEIVIPGGTGPWAQQYDTAVVPAHRGHGLGVRVKASMLQWLRAEHPHLTEVETDNATDNTHMLAVNEQLGFRAYRRTHEYQLTLPTA
ncbi:GNAT family N-acetyltransferase [Streptomyces sp. NPDC023998]|uniref:GNAT family N-acetyltransferase n=1 Tax=Streptomyces sp. NPDC023998 TaxID=3154597 RepID=UPI0033D7F2BF